MYIICIYYKHGYRLGSRESKNKQVTTSCPFFDAEMVLFDLNALTREDSDV